MFTCSLIYHTLTGAMLKRWSVLFTSPVIGHNAVPDQCISLWLLSLFLLNEILCTILSSKLSLHFLHHYRLVVSCRWKSVQWCMLPWRTIIGWLMEERLSLSCARSSPWWRTPGCCSLTCKPLWTPGPNKQTTHTNSGCTHLTNITTCNFLMCCCIG